MNQSTSKHIFASLRDKSMADKICQKLSLRSIPCGVDVDDEKMNHLYVVHETDVAAATDFFRVQIGFTKPIEISKEWESISKVSVGKLTYFILIVCVIVFGLGYMLKISDVYDWLMFGPKQKSLMFIFIEHGQVWRLLTPAFIHFGFMHIIFNLMWWKDLGKVLEYTKGPIFLGCFLIIVGIGSNLLQAVMSGPNFGGLSGVVYGLLGYLWIYKLVNKNFEFGLAKSDVLLMVGWFLLGVSGVFSFGVANWAHGGGLVMGMIIGAIVGYTDKNKINLKEI